MGFELNSIFGGQKDYVNFDLLCRRSIDWLTYTPTVQVRDWPAPYTAAATVLVSCKADFSDEPSLDTMIRSERIPVTFFVPPASDRLIRPLHDIQNFPGSIGALFDPARDILPLAVDQGVSRPEQARLGDRAGTQRCRPARGGGRRATPDRRRPPGDGALRREEYPGAPRRGISVRGRRLDD